MTDKGKPTLIMKIIIIGGSGFIGRALQKELKDHELFLLKGRSVKNMSRDELSEKLSYSDVVINLAGFPINGIWTKKKKKLIYDSRIKSTKKIVEAISLTEKKIHLINASAIGIYETGLKADETSKHYGNNFLGKVVLDWEKEVEKLNEDKVLYTILRFGLVLGNEGGAYPVLRKLVKFNAGAVFSGGNQKVSFIYILDAVKAVRCIIENQIAGVVNMTAPESTDYKTLMNYMKKIFNSLLIWNVPEGIIRFFFGEAAGLILSSHDISPAVLSKNNYNFIAPNIEDCIDLIEES